MGIFDSIRKGINGATKSFTGIDVGAGPGDAIFGKVKTAQAGDSSNYDYGGDPAYAQKMRDYYQQRTDAAGGREAYQIDRSGFNEAYRNEGRARAEQQQALDMYQSAAEGNAPSVAEAQQQQGLEEASRMGQNLVAGAPGVNPLLAATNASAASADAARRSNSATAAMRAQEIADARAGYAGLAGAMRGADAARAGSMLGAEQAQGGFEMQQRGLNDEQQRAYEMYRAQMERDALAGRMGYGNAQTQVSMANAGNSVARRGQNQQFFSDGMKAVGSFAGGKGMMGGIGG